MRLPIDLSNLLAVAIRDVIWFKGGVCAFLRQCGVPEAIMLEVERTKATTPTIKIVHHVLDELAGRGDDGARASREMLTRMYFWKDLHTIPADRKDAAVSSLKALQTGYKRYEAQMEHQREQERSMHQDRQERHSLRTLDHTTLQGFRDEFDLIYPMTNRKERGDQFQHLMNRIFDYYCDKSRGAFDRVGEQIDGLFYFDNHWYFVEVRWRNDKANAADVSVLRDRAKDAKSVRKQ